jgi:hypothetical protein
MSSSIVSKVKEHYFKNPKSWERPHQILFVLVFAVIGVSAVLFTRAASAYGPITGIDGKCLDNHAQQKVDDNKIDLYQCNSTAAQQWNYDAANGTITNVDGYCLDINGDNTRVGTIVDLYQCNGTQAQAWSINSSVGTITSTQSGLCLADKNNKTKNLNQIWMYTCNGSAGQQWKATVASAPVTVAPAITSASSTSFTEGTAGSFTVTDTGTPTPTLSETGTLPTGVTFSPSNGLLSGTSTESGTYSITLTANNGVSPNAVQNFTLTVAGTSGGGNSGGGSSSGSSGSGSGTVTYTTPPASLLTDSVFNDNVTGWAVDPNSSAIVANVITDANSAYPDCSGGVGGCIDWAVNTNRPVYMVPANEPTVSISVSSGCNNFTSNTGTKVPIPSDAVAGDSSDQIMTIYQPSTNTVWEFWLASNSGGSWSACWGGEASMSTFNGVFPNPYGETASGISNLAMQVLGTDCNWDGNTNSGGDPPADRTDCGDNNSNAPEEGMWFRFAPGTTCSSSNCDTPFAQMVFNAGLKYGFIVTDQGGAVGIEADQTNGWTVDGGTGTDPITTSMQGEATYQVLHNLPWSDLQVIDPPSSVN